MAVREGTFDIKRDVLARKCLCDLSASVRLGAKSLPFIGIVMQGGAVICNTCIPAAFAKPFHEAHFFSARPPHFFEMLGKEVLWRARGVQRCFGSGSCNCVLARNIS